MVFLIVNKYGDNRARNLLIRIRVIFYVRKITNYSLLHAGFPHHKGSAGSVGYKNVLKCMIHVIRGYSDENLLKGYYQWMLLSTFISTMVEMPI